MKIRSVGADLFDILQSYLVPDLNDTRSVYSFCLNVNNLKKLQLGT